MITVLYCGNNQLTGLNNLPNSLTKLYCNNNQLMELHNFVSEFGKLFNPVN